MSYNLTNEQIKDTYQQLVQISGSTLVDGTGSVIPQVNVSASHAVTASYAANVSSPDWSAVQNKPAGLVSSSAQVNYQQISNVPSGIVSGSSQLTGSLDQRYVLSGSISQADWNTLLNKPAGIVSGSSQVQLSQITGNTFANANYTFPQNLTVQGTLTAETFITEYVSSSVIYDSGSTKFGDSLDDTHQFTGSVQVLGGITGSLLGEASAVEFANVLNKPTLISSSAQIATEISGAFDSTSGSLAGRVTTLEQFSSSLDATFATDAQLSAVSGALAGTITNVDGRVVILEGKTLISGSSQINYPDISNIPAGILSSSAQIATEISGAFDSTSGSLAGRVTTLEQFSSSLDANFVTETELANATGSFLTTGSINNDTITLIKADSSTFDLIVNNVTNALTSSFALTASFALNTLSGSVSWDQVQSKPTGLVSSSNQVNYPDLSNIPAGIISGSDQLTGSFDQRYALSGSAPTADWNTLLNKPAGIVSGSSQIILIDTTGDLSGSRIVGDVNTAVTASYASNAELFDNKDSATFATTGSNTFTGIQTFNGPVNFADLSIGEQFITVNTNAAYNDGGIIVQSGSAGTGSAMYYDLSEERWAYAAGASDSATTITPQAFAPMFISGSENDTAYYQKPGNMKVVDGELYIYF